MLINIFNTITYQLRNKIAFSRPIKNIINEDKKNIFSSEDVIQEEKRILNNYNLDFFHENSSIIHYKENLYTLKLLEETFNSINLNAFTDKKNLKILDIGSKNFSYAPAIHHFFNNKPINESLKNNIELTGIEIDPYRILSDLHSRYDYAMYYTQKLSKTNYITGDVLSLTEAKYDIITWFLPFIVKDPLIKWGLPLKYFKPKTMLNHAYKILNHRGIILLVNQGEAEKKAQVELIKELNLNYTSIEEAYTNCFSPYKLKRYITVITKG
ncbi:MAG: hypothetical protein AB7V50_00415 [Vampirovibrionia bacterium]